ncbi:MAG: DUF3656 domain-containing protein, partial [Oscillospiraceae bacterium]
ASTQMAVATLSGALQMAEMGFSRVILARELSKTEIEYITKNCGIETEVFVHGAMCMGVSGQCYLSAFLGGRSGNRGDCAGPCRLPFSAREGHGAVSGVDGDFHLSLKDQSLVDFLPELQEMGVASVKIEGRLRSEQYVAAAVNACRATLNGEEYDKTLLEDIFSRSGFSNGYYMAKRDGEMFGIRTREENQRTKAAMPKLNELFRKQLQTLALDIKLDILADEMTLTITDENGNTVTEKDKVELSEAKGDNFVESVKKSLEKLGGTPFFAENIQVNVPTGKYLPLSQINLLRRSCVEKLTAMRETSVTHVLNDFVLPKVEGKKVPAKEIYARFQKVSQIPETGLDMLDKIILPIDEMVKTDEMFSEDAKTKIVMELPRGQFGNDVSVSEKIQQAIKLGFNNFEINNIGHLQLLKSAQGVNIYAGFPMNITNSLAAESLADLGVCSVTLSPETRLNDIKKINIPAKTGILGYGHLPLMMTRACPKQNVTSCDKCDKKGILRDRKGREFNMTCQNGVREIYNPVPLYMGERQREVFADFITLYFTNEAKGKVSEVLQGFENETPFSQEFTRGLYY